MIPDPKELVKEALQSGPAGVKGRQAKPGTMERLDERSARKQAVIDSREYNRRRSRMSPGFRSGFLGTSSARPAQPGTAARRQQKRDRRRAALENMRTRTFAAGPNPGQTAGPSRFSPAAARRVDEANTRDSSNRRGAR